MTSFFKYMVLVAMNLYRAFTCNPFGNGATVVYEVPPTRLLTYYQHSIFMELVHKILGITAPYGTDWASD
jgi:hypothetical protein